MLADELRGLGAAEVEPGRGGVHFSGDLALLYRANLWLRTAIRVLRPILEATVDVAGRTVRRRALARLVASS